MKRILKAMLGIAVVANLTACHLDKIDSGAESLSGEVGYLKIGQVMVNGDNEGATIKPEVEPVAQSAVESNVGVATRATTPEEAGDDYYVVLWRKDASGNYVVAMQDNGTTPHAYLYSAVKNNPIALEPATYWVTAYDSKGLYDGTAAVASVGDVARYAALQQTPTEGIAVTKEHTQTAPAATTVTCKQVNIKTTVELSADLKDSFREYASTDAEYATNRLKVDVSIEDDDAAIWTYESESTHDSPVKYFRDVKGPGVTAGNTMTIHMSGMYYTGNKDEVDNTTGEFKDGYNASNATGAWKEVTMTKTIEGVKAAQWRKISIDIDRNTSGDVQFEVTVENLVYDETISVDVVSVMGVSSGEETIPDVDAENPEAPNFDQPALSFSSNDYNSSAGSWTKVVEATITPTTGSTVKEIYATLVSDEDSQSLFNALVNKGFTDGKLMLYSENAASDYCVVALQDDGKVKITLKATCLTKLVNSYLGEHTFLVRTTDNLGRAKTTEVTLKVSGQVSGPKIEWLANGESASEIEVVTGLEQVEVTITSTSGITGLAVEIESDRLDDEELGSVGLNSSMNLIDPGSAEIETSLRKLGFLPVDYAGQGYTDEQVAAMTDEEKTACAEADDSYRIYDLTIADADDDGKHTTKKDPEVQSPLIGVKEQHYDISKFMSLLKMLGKSTSKFTLIATDAEGTNDTTPFTIVIN